MAYRILSCSGGGARGVFQAAYLRGLAGQLPEKPPSQNFDLIAGTSTGAIVAAAVALDVGLDEAVGLFKDHSPGIFTSRWGWYWSLFKGSRYRRGALESALKEVFEDSKLGDCRTPVLFAATTLDRYNSRVFCSFEDGPDRDMSVVDAVLASCAAPTYFDPVKPGGEERSYVDGGMWANSPMLHAVLRVHEDLGVSFEDMRVLSLGNGEVPAGARAREYGAWRVGPRLITTLFDMMFTTQSSSAREATEALIGRDNLMEINVQLSNPIALDDARNALEVLPPLAEEKARSTGEEVAAFLYSRPRRSPKDVLVNDVLRSLHRYGYPGIQGDDRRVRSLLDDGRYIRSQNFLELLEKGLLNVKEEFCFINDHPFRPFGELVLKNMAPEAKYLGINGRPDDLYRVEDVERRLAFLRKKGADARYYLMPSEEIHLSILVFDRRAVLVYPTPESRTVCDFSEGLFYLAPQAVEEWRNIYSHIEEVAVRHAKATGRGAADDLQLFCDFQVSRQ